MEMARDMVGETGQVKVELPEFLVVETDKLKRLFDIICDSMDFGSGFLETDDVKVLRELAVVLSVDPMSATPDGQHRYFKHEYVEWKRSDKPHCDEAYWNNWYADRCRWCSQDDDADCHQLEVTAVACVCTSDSVEAHPGVSQLNTDASCPVHGEKADGPGQTETGVTHGWTVHGHPCCRRARLAGRPASIARCGGPGMCDKCSESSARIHDENCHQLEAQEAP